MSRKYRTRSKYQSTPIKPALEITNSIDSEQSETVALYNATLPETENLLKRGTSDLTPEEDEEEYKNPVVNRFQKRKSTYYSVTESEINMYAQLGVISTLFLTLFGALIGFAGGCLVALIQKNIPYETEILLKIIGLITGFISIIFLIVSLWFIRLQFNNKKLWESTD